MLPFPHGKLQVIDLSSDEQTVNEDRSVAAGAMHARCGACNALSSWDPF